MPAINPHFIFPTDLPMHGEESQSQKKQNYLNALSSALQGIPWSETQRPLTFRRSLSQVNPGRIVPNRTTSKTLKLSSKMPDLILDGPGLDETMDAPSHLIEPLDHNALAVACGKGIYKVTFSHNALSKTENLCKDRNLSTISHISILDVAPDSISLIAAGQGSFYHIQREIVEQTISHSPYPSEREVIIDLAALSPSTFLAATQTNGMGLVDLREKKATALVLKSQPTCLAVQKDTPFPLIAAGCSKALTVFDLRSTLPLYSSPLCHPATAVAWKRFCSPHTLFAACTGSWEDTPTLMAYHCTSILSPSCTAKTHGIVVSILIAHDKKTLVTIENTPPYRCSEEAIGIWDTSQELSSPLTLTDVSCHQEGADRSCGAIDASDQSLLVAYPEAEVFLHWSLSNPSAAKQPPRTQSPTFPWPIR